MRILLFIFIITVVAVPSLASAAASQFIPKIFDYSGELTLEMRYQNDKRTSGNDSRQVTDTTLTEKLELFTIGYVYHPNFITFTLKLSGGLREEKYTSTSRDLPWKTDPTTGYYFTMYVLPSHPYNLELFTSRFTSATASSVFGGVQPETTLYGARLKYEKRPIMASLSYSHRATQAGPSGSESQAYSANATYFRGRFVNTAGYDHLDYKTTFNNTSSNDKLFFTNEYNYTNQRLLSEISINENYQEEPNTGSLRLNSLLWKETLALKLPWNFTSGLTYRFQRDTTERTGLQTLQAPESKVTTHDAGFNINHRLYASLFSQYALSFASSRYPLGESRRMTNSLNLSYLKKIPFGLMVAGTNYSFSHSERKGQSLAINENHTATNNYPLPPDPVTGTFRLNNEDVEESTIEIRVKTVVPPEETPIFVKLQKDFHYRVTSAANAFSITIDRLDGTTPEVCRTMDCESSTYQYIFQASYASRLNDRTTDTKTYGFNLRFELFQNLFSPFFSYDKTIQSEVSDTEKPLDIEQTTTSIGFKSQLEPFILLAQYQKIESDLNPSSSLSSELSYLKALSYTVTLNGKILYRKEDYPLALSGNNTGYSLTVYGAEAGVIKTFPSRRLTTTLSLGYARSEGLATASNYILKSSLSWKLGNTDIMFTGKASLSQSKGIRTQQDLASEFFYLTVRRRLF